MTKTFEEMAFDYGRRRAIGERTHAATAGFTDWPHKSAVRSYGQD
jgi:hypothetical protein